MRIRRFSIITLLVCILAASNACSSLSRSAGGTSGENHQDQQQVSLSQNAGAATEVNVNLDFTLTNFTGSSLRGLYLSSATSTGWEENMLAGADLKDGDSVDIRFNPNEKTIVWDMKVEGVAGHYAEWKNLDLVDVSEITLVLKPSPHLVVMAEVE